MGVRGATGEEGADDEEEVECSFLSGVVEEPFLFGVTMTRLNLRSPLKSALCLLSGVPSAGVFEVLVWFAYSSWVAWISSWMARR